MGAVSWGTWAKSTPTHRQLGSDFWIMRMREYSASTLRIYKGLRHSIHWPWRDNTIGTFTKGTNGAGLSLPRPQLGWRNPEWPARIMASSGVVSWVSTSSPAPPALSFSLSIRTSCGSLVHHSGIRSVAYISLSILPNAGSRLIPVYLVWHIDMQHLHLLDFPLFPVSTVVYKAAGRQSWALPAFARSSIVTGRSVHPVITKNESRADIPKTSVE